MSLSGTPFERRRRERFFMESKVECILNRSNEQVSFEGDIVDISALGICFNTSVELKEGQEVRFGNTLPAGHRTAVVVWIKKTENNNYKVGLQFN